MQAKIIILSNKKCQFVVDDELLSRRLRSRLSYRMKGVEYTAAYANGWNGITYLLSNANKFNIGLLDNVKDFLNTNKIDFTIEDKRTPKSLSQELDISENLNKYGLTPRDYQLRIVDSINNNDRGIIRAATGSGKSLASALMVAKLNKPTIIYVIGLDLLSQFHELFSKLFNEEIGFIGNGVCEIKRITIASIWTIGKALDLGDDLFLDDENDSKELSPRVENCFKIKELLKQTKVHIFDECHVVTTNTISAIYKQIDPEYIYGMSASPYRDDGSDLLVTSILGQKIVDISASELIEKGILAQPIIRFISVPKKIMHSTNYQHVYKTFIVENEERNQLILKYTQELLAKKYTPLVLFRYIRHGEILLELFEEAKINCVMLYGNDSLARRNEIKEKVSNKEIDVVLGSTIYDMGIDLPILSALVLCGGGCSSIRTIQRVGRCVRMYPNKKHVAIVDFYDPVRFLKQHSLTRYSTYCLEPGFIVKKCKEMK
jgi:superfamily II DNA or RNA helicase